MGFVFATWRSWMPGIVGAGCITGCVTSTSSSMRACETQRVTGDGPFASLSVTSSTWGTTAAWITPSGVMTQRFADDGSPAETAGLAWPGTFDSTTVASVDDYVVLSAVAGEVSVMANASFGQRPYRELGLLSGIAGASPVVVAGGDPVSASVSWGGLLVNGFDAQWNVITAELSVLTPNASEVTMTANAEQALVVWPTGDACFFEAVYDKATGSDWSDPVTCSAPRLASTASDAALVFERDGGIYFVRAAPAQLHASNATRIAAGSMPRIVAIGDAYWVGYLDAAGEVVIARPGTSAALSLRAADLFELTVVGGTPQIFATAGDVLDVSTVCSD
jgi:hypothetical protein